MARKKPVIQPDSEPAVELQDDGPELPVTPVTAQFPAVDGTDEGFVAEISQRSADGSDGDLFHKVFMLGRVGVGAEDPVHRVNAAGVVQEAVQRGLHPRGDVYLQHMQEHDAPLNASGSRRQRYTELRYAVRVVPASIDLQPHRTTTPSAITHGERVSDDADDVGDSG